MARTKSLASWFIPHCVQQNSGFFVANGALVVGGFYTPSHQVENNMDNDGGVHPGSLQYYRAEFPKNGFQILSEYNFTYAACDYCPIGQITKQATIRL